MLLQISHPLRTFISYVVISLASPLVVINYQVILTRLSTAHSISARSAIDGSQNPKPAVALEARILVPDRCPDDPPPSSEKIGPPSCHLRSRRLRFATDHRREWWSLGSRRRWRGEERGAEECRSRDAGEPLRRHRSRRPEFAASVQKGAAGVHGTVGGFASG